MSSNYSLEDTQPRPPVNHDRSFDSPDDWMIPSEGQPTSSGPGCVVWGCVSLFVIGFAIAIVLLAGYAGWNSGQRTASANATATKDAEIVEQLNRIPQDLASGNVQLAIQRLRFLSLLTPGVPGVAEFAATATAIYQQGLPTQMPSPTPTQQIDVTEVVRVEITAAPEGPQFDLPALLQEARQQVGSGQFAEAYESLDVIMAVDANFQRAEVRDLMTQTLNGQARGMFNSSNPAQGIIWATRAESLGVLQGDVSVELDAALRWQSAQAAVGLDYNRAIQALQGIMNIGEGGRYYAQARQLLIDQYVAFANALIGDPTQGYCPAVQQFENAANVSNDSSIGAQLSNARSLCAQATPIPGPDETSGAPPAGQADASGGVAPVGQP